MYAPRKVHLPALAVACAVALGLTLGMPAAMQWHAASPAALAQANARVVAGVSAPHTEGSTARRADEAVMAPGTIRIEVVAQRPVSQRWWSSLVHLPTT